ncbi:MAG: replication initiator protein A [Erysipelotrichaceae bacterium]|nr:replication initiator protein A [Erysipelotrichaceae bacterium]
MSEKDKNNNLIYYSPEMIMQLEFYQFPKWLLTLELNSDSKLLYMILLDRYKLSLKNGWIDDDNRVYMIYTRSEAMEMLRIGNKKCVKLFDELKGNGLVEERRLGFTKPNILYLKGINYIKPIVKSENLYEKKLMCQNDTSGNLMCQNNTSRSVKRTHHEVSKQHLNNNYISNNDMNNETDSKEVQFISPEEIEEWDIDEFYSHLNDQQYQSFERLLKLSNKGVLHSSKESLIDYFKKLILNQWKDASGQPIRNIEGYVKMNFSFYQSQQKRKQEET